MHWLTSADVSMVVVEIQLQLDEFELEYESITILVAYFCVFFKTLNHLANSLPKSI